jgi:hypothetical protein
MPLKKFLWTGYDLQAVKLFGQAYRICDQYENEAIGGVEAIM